MKLINNISFIFINLYLFQVAFAGIIPELNIARQLINNAKTPDPSHIEPANSNTTQKPKSTEPNISTVESTSTKVNTELDDKQTTTSTTVQPATVHSTTVKATSVQSTQSPSTHSTSVKSTSVQPTEPTTNKYTTDKQRTNKNDRHHNKQKDDDLPFVFPLDTTKDLINKEINEIKKILNNSEIFININSYSSMPDVRYKTFKQPHFCKYKPLNDCKKYTFKNKIYICRKDKYFNPETCECDLKKNVKSCENGIREIKESIETMDNSKEDDSNEVEVFNDKTFILDFFNIFKHIFD